MSTQTTTLFVVTIDTEEDNWGQHRSGIQCENIRQIPRLQGVFDQYGIVPTYLVTYQVCLHEWATDILKGIQQRGKCEIGCHLHPWNTPPISEDLTAENSFLKNLPYDLQLAKLKTISNKIEQVFSLQPQSFRTGRWGLGRQTLDALLACGYRVDTSVTPTLSWKNDGNGPVYTSTETDPYPLPAGNGYTRGNDSIVEVPATIGYNRWPFSFWNRIYGICENPLFKPFHLVGVLNRASMLRKLWLTPEGFSSARMISLADILIRHDKRLLNLSFHSNTLLPGKTPFTHSDQDVENLYTSLATLFTHLHKTTNLRSMTLSEVAAEQRGFQSNRR